ncbi:hypothetical protein [Stenotrophomonas sp. NLF4-10]|uniref:hypothetical protein n=1 Tax=Stenotrophomonas sp. NLF4-10 TaxID=2918754 RepID=UPI001EFBFFE4|nr:hypothetical protein [Stenotrophomonas sp. NLF4-10]MCG8277696.1 hypothetical protein [Stenotrophomonas sp. NLF4-10]
MNLPPLLSRLRQSRRSSLTVFGITLAALVITAVWFLSARSALAEAYAQLGERKQALAEAQVREQEAQLRVDHAHSSHALLDAAQANGLQPEAWGERLINLRQSQMSREDTAAVLGAVTRSGDRMFGAEAFELSVTHPDEGLFDAPVVSDRAPAPLQLTLRGAILFRTGATDAAPLPAGVAP